jgi:hypothetical protein
VPNDLISDGEQFCPGFGDAVHSFLAIPVTSMVAGTVPLFSIQWLVFRSAVNVSPGPYSLATSPRCSMTFPDRM